jgi:hypothetical protein
MAGNYSRSRCSSPPPPIWLPKTTSSSRGVKEELAGVGLTLESLRKIWGGFILNTGVDELAVAIGGNWTAATSAYSSKWIHGEIFRKKTLLTIAAVMFFNLILNALCISV